jgi:hypothetical protein
MIFVSQIASMDTHSLRWTLIIRKIDVSLLASDIAILFWAVGTAYVKFKLNG